MPHARVNGQELFYAEEGSGEPAIAFSHGLLMDHSMFASQVAALGGRHRCIAWDERGHGQTRSTLEEFSYWDSARDLLGLLDELGVQQAVLCGMSQGGYLSLRAALLAPERVKALILIDTQAGVEDPAKVGGYDQLIAGWEAGGLSQEVADIVASIILGPGFPDTPKWQARWRDVDVQVLRQIYTTLTSREDDVNPRLAELTMPALVIHGSDDVAIELDVARRLVEALPNGSLAVIEGAGHAANLTHPEAVNPHIERFLATL